MPERRQHPQAVFFDLDGTLVDTMPLHYRAYREVLAELGVELSMSEFLTASAGPARETIPKMLVGKPVGEVSVTELHKRKQDRAAALFAAHPPPLLETAKLLDVFGGSRLGLVSSGSRRSVDLTLMVAGIFDRFDVVITGDDVIAGKPDPEGYLIAAGRLHVTPSACFVFEDSDAGVLAASSAGMSVFDTRRAIPSWSRL